jgi:hypothetical protein
MKCPALGTSATVGRHHCYVAIRQTSCPAAHNAYATVSFNSYGGTVTRTPLEAVNRLGWILATLRSPARFTSVAPRTVTVLSHARFETHWPLCERTTSHNCPTIMTRSAGSWSPRPSH